MVLQENYLKKINLYIKKKYKKRNFKFLFLSEGFNLRSTEINAFIGIMLLKKINKWIAIRNKNYKYFSNILSNYSKSFIIPIKNNISSFVLPFLMFNKIEKNNLEKKLNSTGIETRPFIAGNLLNQPFLNYKYKNNFKNANFIDNNCFYIGNNQFVDNKRLKKLKKILDNFFIKK